MPQDRPNAATTTSLLSPTDSFQKRHIGPRESDQAAMLATLGYASLEALGKAAVPSGIQLDRALSLPAAASEAEALAELRGIAEENQVLRSFLGQGYHGCITPPVILRNVLENPGWYTQYTPYQAEISQGRLEALLNFQTMVADLTGLPLAGASLLDEGTAAAEAMAMAFAIHRQKRTKFFVAADCHAQTIAVVRTRAEAMDIELVEGPASDAGQLDASFCGFLLQYPNTLGHVVDHRALIASGKGEGAVAILAADLLALCLITSPGELGADIAVGTTQRFGVPMGFGGPHAGYIATSDDHARKIPGRIIGVSRDANGALAYRMAIQTREQHIRRERATSNICTAQALLAIMAGFYAVYHGPEGLRAIARRVHGATQLLALGLTDAGHTIVNEGAFFDTLEVTPANGDAAAVIARALALGINLRLAGRSVVVSLDETVEADDLHKIVRAFSADAKTDLAALEARIGANGFPTTLVRESAYLTHPIFNRHRSETDMLRYITQLQRRDLSLADSMIALGSCTMKLNATAEMLPVTWPEFGQLHPFVPADQAKGYAKLHAQLETWLSEITGFAGISLQPNAGSQGELAGLLVIRAYHKAKGEDGRRVCLIPTSAHGTNPASAVIAGMRVVTVKCDDAGNVDVDDLRAKAEKHSSELGALMITYPSTHGVFEASIREICDVVHQHGGQVYMDGANMNAQVGLCRPGDFGADVCHLNLHKTFCIPHGGGGPGMGPIGVGPHLVPYLPGHPVVAPASSGPEAAGTISAAPYGSPSILPISWMYIRMMGPKGLKAATETAILNANYMAKRLGEHFPVLFTGQNGLCAHEFILDLRPFDKTAGVKIDDVAKRLADYGFHAPTMSFPVPGTLMIEPTESEPREELDRFCEAMIGIREEIRALEEGRADREDNVLRNAPHTIGMVCADNWSHPYSREEAAYPRPWLRAHKFWPAVGRIDNAYGDRNLVCACPPLSEYE